MRQFLFEKAINRRFFLTMSLLIQLIFWFFLIFNDYMLYAYTYVRPFGLYGEFRYSYTNYDFFDFIFVVGIFLFVFGGKLLSLKSFQKLKLELISEQIIFPKDYSFTPGKLYLLLELNNFKFSFPKQGMYIVTKSTSIPMHISTKQTNQIVYIEFESTLDKFSEDYIFEELLNGVDITKEYQVILKVYQHKKRYFGVVEVEKCSI